MKHLTSLAGFIAGVLGVSFAISAVARPGPWYAALEKPGFTPPNWVFAPVWTVLYILIAIAGWRVWRREPNGGAMRLWILQMALNFAWTPIFFGAHQIGAAFAVITALFATILAFMVIAYRLDRWASLMFAPYACWVGYASAVNGGVWALNP